MAVKGINKIMPGSLVKLLTMEHKHIFEVIATDQYYATLRWKDGGYFGKVNIELAYVENQRRRYRVLVISQESFDSMIMKQRMYFACETIAGWAAEYGYVKHTTFQRNYFKPLN